MFDIGFTEIVLVAVVALIVIGPERLPAVARTLGFWVGKVRRFVTSVQADFQREVVKSEELKQLLEQQSKIKDVHEIIEQTVDDTRKTIPVGAKLAPDQQSASEQDTPSKQNSIQPPSESAGGPESSGTDSNSKSDQQQS